MFHLGCPVEGLLLDPVGSVHLCFLLGGSISKYRVGVQSDKVKVRYRKYRARERF